MTDSTKEKMLFVAERKGGAEEFRVTAGEFEGKPTLQLRVWFLGKDREFHPTQKGVSIRRGELTGVIAVLQATEPDGARRDQ